LALGPAGRAALAAGGLLGAAIALAMLVAGPAAGEPRPRAASPVTVSSDDAYLDTFQALNAVDEVSRSKSDSDFVRFAETLQPATLSGIEGKADALASQASTVVTPSFTTPFESVGGIGVSARLGAKGHKNVNGAAGVPVAFADGEFDASFESTGRIPIELAGHLQAINSDADECTEVSVVLNGETFLREFGAADGVGCTPGLHPNRGFLVSRTLPPSEGYELEVDYGGTISAEEPGSTEKATAAVDLTLTIYPPNTRITSVRISSRRGVASFDFKATRGAKRLQCALTRKGKRPRFRKCRSPKSYRNLKPGRYAFQARAVGPLAPEATPAKKSFRIR